MTTTRSEVSSLLAALRDGEKEALPKLVPLVYEELRRAARRHLRGRRPGGTLDTTALVHEAYVRLAGSSSPEWRDRRHFLAVAAMAMRQILVDHARRHAASKRGGGVEKVRLEESRVGSAPPAEELLALDEALRSLEARDERLSRVVELHYFLELTFEETGRVLGLTERTARRDWMKARAFLFQTLRGEPLPGEERP